MRCTVCEAHVAADQLRLLAQRDDLLFLEVHCPACGSTGLGFVTAGASLPEADRLAGGSPMSADDVLDMHELLGAWTGDLRTLVGRADVQRDGRGRPAAARSGRFA
jgi:hypothetical protein